MFASNNRALRYMREKLMELKKLYKFTIVVMNFSLPFSVINRAKGQKIS